MSAIRNNIDRAEERKKRALPYSRRIVRKVFQLFGYGGEEESELPALPTTAQSTDRKASDEQISNDPPRPQGTARQGSSQQPSFSKRQPLSQVDFSNISTLGAKDPPPSAFSTIPDVSSVANFFSNKTGTKVDANFVESVVAELQTTPEKTEKFRFTFTTPTQESSSFFSMNSTPTSSSVTPSSKKLTRNPNGTYRWDGAGSAKHARPRNRFASPAFGASLSKPDRLTMKDNNSFGETDHKRRKTGESAIAGSTSESSGSSLPFPITASPSTPKVKNTPGRPPAAAPAVLPRTPAKPTAPVVPSPLRQAWSDAPSPSSRDELQESPGQQAKPTKTASFMADLIKETTLPQKPDLSNPYQTASPVGKVGPPRRSTRRPRATGRPAAVSKDDQIEDEKKRQEKEKLDAYSSQAIIEATVPKGSKRSRPPTHFEKNGMDVSEETTTTQYQVEEPEDNESGRSAKKPKPSLNGNGRPHGLFNMPSTPSPTASSDIIIEEINDVPIRETSKDEDKDKVKANGKDATTSTSSNVSAASAASASSATPRASFSAMKSIPKEPSKLRFSFQAEGSPASAPTSSLPTPSPVSDPKPSPLQFASSEQSKFAALSTGFDFSFKPEAKGADESKAAQSDGGPPTIEEIKASITAMAVDILPVFTFTLTAISTPSTSQEHVRARGDVKVLPPLSLPSFDFSRPVVESPSPSGFKFSLTSSQSTSTLKDTPRPSPPITAPPAPVKAFDFAAAGMKMEVKKDVWTCSVCSVSNANSAIQCIACESPAPSNAASKSAEAPKPTPLPVPAPVKGFDFAAAGFKMPTVNKDTWTCSECTLSNPNSASKCGPCGADRK